MKNIPQNDINDLFIMSYRLVNLVVKDLMPGNMDHNCFQGVSTDIFIGAI